jgi:hypothetical protein
VITVKAFSKGQILVELMVLLTLLILVLVCLHGVGAGIIAEVSTQPYWNHHLSRYLDQKKTSQDRHLTQSRDPTSDPHSSQKNGAFEVVSPLRIHHVLYRFWEDLNENLEVRQSIKID